MTRAALWRSGTAFGAGARNIRIGGDEAGAFVNQVAGEFQLGIGEAAVEADDEDDKKSDG